MVYLCGRDRGRGFAVASRAAVLHAGTILVLFASDDLFDAGGSAGYRRGKPGKAAG